MSAAVSLASAIDWLTVAPEDWQYLADLLPWPTPPARPSGIVLHEEPAVARDLPPEQRAAINCAVRVVGTRLRRERREELRQEIALILLEQDTSKIGNLGAWLVTCARNALAGEDRKEARCREILEETHTLGAPRGYRKRKETTSPRWLTEEFAPFACKGARVMRCKGAPRPRDVETALVEAIDERTKTGNGPPRTPTGRQDFIAIQAIRDRRAHTGSQFERSKQENDRGREVRASSLVRAKGSER